MKPIYFEEKQKKSVCSKRNLYNKNEHASTIDFNIYL